MGTEAKGKKKVTSGKKGRKKAGGRDSSSFLPLAPSRLWELGIMPASIFPTFSSPPPPIPACRASFFRAGNTSTVDVQQCMIFRSPFAFRLLLRAPSEREDLHVCLRTFLREAPLSSSPLHLASGKRGQTRERPKGRELSLLLYFKSRKGRWEMEGRRMGPLHYDSAHKTTLALSYLAIQGWGGARKRGKRLWGASDSHEGGRREKGKGGSFSERVRTERERGGKGRRPRRLRLWWMVVGEGGREGGSGLRSGRGDGRHTENKKRGRSERQENSLVEVGGG